MSEPNDVCQSDGPNHGSQPILLSAGQLAQLLGISTRTLWRRDGAGDLPRPVMVGPTKRWRRGEIEAWVAGGCPSRTEWDTRKEITLAQGAARTRR